MMRIFLLVGLLALLAPMPSSASNCNFDTRGAAALDDFDVLRILRCLVNELDKLQRENATLKRRLIEIEGVVTEMPAAYSNVDGEVTREEGRAIGRATFVLSARSTGGANALPIDQAVLEEVCAKSGGCAVSIGFRQLSLFNDVPKDSVLVGPCQFAYGSDGAWSLGDGCGATKSGKDGDQSAAAAASTDPVIAEASGACLFSEAAPGRGVGQDGSFARDQRIGLFLIAMPERQTDGIRRFQCELVLN